MTRLSDLILERLTRLHPKVIDLSLERIERLLARLDHPERRLPPVVHIAGTNGKGSLVAYLEAMLRAAGRPVQSYISPHLVRFHERIRFDGAPIDETDLARLLARCENANGPAAITFFEITTAAAFLAFAERPADLLLLETGLGGRLDATNVVERPRLTAITPVSMDHMQFLGDSLPAIAGEKAGILKTGVPAVVGPQDPAALEVIQARAAELDVALYRHGRDWLCRLESGRLVFDGRRGTRVFPLPVLAGLHQVDNAGMALACAELLEDLELPESARAAGLTRAVWPARMQRLTRGPLVERLPEGWELWLDGGHNAAAGTALAASLTAWSDRPIHLVYGMLNSKAAGDFLRPLAPLCGSLGAIAIPGETNSLSAEAAAGHDPSGRAVACGSLADALERVLAAGPDPARVLICGSLYLAGQVLAEHG